MKEQILSKMKELKKKQDRTIDNNPARTLIMPALAVGLILLNRYIGISKMEMNLILLLVFLVELLGVMAAKKNVTKIFWLIGAIAAATESVLYNFFEEGHKFPLTSIQDVINGFCGIWLGLLVLVFIYLVIVCIRVSRWTQEEWEKVKEIRQEYRKQWLEAHIQLWKIRKQYIIEYRRQEVLLKQQNFEERIKQQTHEHEIRAEQREGELKEKREKSKYDFEMNQRRWEAEEAFQDKLNKMRYDSDVSEEEKALMHKSKINELQRQQEIERKEKRQNLQEMNIIKQLRRRAKCIANFLLEKILPLAFAAVIVIFYVLLPMKGEKKFEISVWIEQTGQFMETFKEIGEKGSEKEINEQVEPEDSGTFEALIEYTIFYIAFVGTAVSVLFLICKTMEGVVHWMFKGKPSYTGFSGFFAEYSIPFVILIVTVSVLLTLADAGAIMDNLPQLFSTLAGTVICIMLTLIAADAIRLILIQSIKPDSLLRAAMHLSFVLLIDNVMGIVIGVLSKCNLKAAIMSLFSFFTHYEEEGLQRNIEETMDDFLDKEIQYVKEKAKKSPNKKAETSAFSDFSSKHWSSRKS